MFDGFHYIMQWTPSVANTYWKTFWNKTLSDTRTIRTANNTKLITHEGYPGNLLIAIDKPPRKPRKSKSQQRHQKNDVTRKRSGSHDDLLCENDEPQRTNRFLLCPPVFTSTADIPHHYDTVFDVPIDKGRRKGSHGEVKRSLLKSIRSNSVIASLAVPGSLSSETAKLLTNDD